MIDRWMGRERESENSEYEDGELIDGGELYDRSMDGWRERYPHKSCLKIENTSSHSSIR